MKSLIPAGYERRLGRNAAAEYIGKSVRCLEEWHRKGVGPKAWKTNVSGKIYYAIPDLDAYLESRREKQRGDVGKA